MPLAVLLQPAQAHAVDASPDLDPGSVLLSPPPAAQAPAPAGATDAKPAAEPAPAELPPDGDTIPAGNALPPSGEEAPAPAPAPSGEPVPAPLPSGAAVAPGAESPGPPPSAGQLPPLELNVSGNRQVFDSQLGRFVATGNVAANLAGGRLLADRMEYDADSRTLYAFGSVRFQRGQQFMQASKLRYSLLEGVGEMEDVYGILDLDSSQQDLDLAQMPATPLPEPEPMSCQPALPPVPQWHPYPWAVTGWGGRMFHSDFGQTFNFEGILRPETLLGGGVMRRLIQLGPFAIDLDINGFGHWANAQKGSLYTGPYTKEQVKNLQTDAQVFGEFTAGLMLRAWLRPWLSLGFEEGFSLLTSVSNYEDTYRERSSRFLNYLALEVEALVSPQWSAVGRIHHRSGAFGTYNGVSEGSNAYLLGVRYRFGEEPQAFLPEDLPPPQGCPNAPPPGSRERAEGLAQQLETVTMGPGDLWARARRQERERREAIQRIDQRVRDVKFQQSLSAERRYGFPSQLSTPDAANQFGQVVPTQLRRLDTKENRQLVKGSLSRWRLQAGRIRFTPTTLSGDRIAFSNDPFTPAQAWLDSENVVATLQPNGDTVIKARRNTLLLDDRLPIPVSRTTRIQKQEEVENRWVLGNDREDRDGFFIGRDFEFRSGQRGRLTVQPQFLVQRAFNDETDSYPLPGQPQGFPAVQQPAKAGDLFGLEVNLNQPIGRWDLAANFDLSTFNPDNIADGTRTFGDLSAPLTLPLLGKTTARLFGAYRFRTWNGSLGEEDVYAAGGISLENAGALPMWGRLSSNYYWRTGVGNFKANVFDSRELTALWRYNAIGSLNASLPLWTGTAAPATASAGLQNTAVPIVPGLSLNANLLGTVAYFGDGTNQNTLSLSGGPTLTLGRFIKPFLDYTQLTITGSGTLRQGLSPLAFDRAVDLGTLGIGVTQQLVGPLLFNGGIGVNVDPGSEFYGDVVSSYVELRWQRRAYEISIFYSPYDGLGGVRVKLNDFNFKGPGVPFVPLQPTQVPLQRPF